MITIIQRVSQAAVTINSKDMGAIGPGILALIAVEKEDTEKQANRLLERILDYRIFSDPDGRMNLSLRDCRGGLLLVPQFTLAADTRKGNRPSFTSAAAPKEAERLFKYFLQQAKSIYAVVESGQFGADMQVSLINDGPVTFTLQVNNK